MPFSLLVFRFPDQLFDGFVEFGAAEIAKTYHTLSVDDEDRRKAFDLPGGTQRAIVAVVNIGPGNLLALKKRAQFLRRRVGANTEQDKRPTSHSFDQLF